MEEQGGIKGKKSYDADCGACLVHVGNPGPCSARAKSTLDPRDVMQGKEDARMNRDRTKVGGGRSEEVSSRLGDCPSMEVDFRVDGGLGRIWESPPSDDDPLWYWETQSRNHALDQDGETAKNTGDNDENKDESSSRRRKGSRRRAGLWRQLDRFGIGAVTVLPGT
ncbi:hypothetical protein N7512_006798 [Penicillium capsulatum]|nr:hypothetical protein N7512_006798 [Penicillium capsulatum]